jgi:excisionase family DNA binding protein
MTLEQYYTIEEVAEKLKVTRQAIHNWIKEGRLDSIKIGRARRIPAASIERLLEQSKQRSLSQEQPVNKTHPVLAAAW